MSGWQPPDQASHWPAGYPSGRQASYPTRSLTQSPLVNRLARHATSSPGFARISPHAVYSEAPVVYSSVYCSPPSSTLYTTSAPVPFHGAQSSFSSSVSPPLSWMQVARAVSAQGRLGPVTSLAMPPWPENAALQADQVISRSVFDADVETFRPSSSQLSRSSFGGVQKTTPAPVFPSSQTGSDLKPDLHCPSYVQCAPLLGRLDQFVCASCGAPPSPPETDPPRSAVAAARKPYQPKFWGKSASESSTISAATSFIMSRRDVAAGSVHPRSGRAGPVRQSTDTAGSRPTQIIRRETFEDNYPCGVKNLIKKFEGHSKSSSLLPTHTPQRRRSQSDDCVTRTSASSASVPNTPVFADRFHCPIASSQVAVRARGGSEVASSHGAHECSSVGPVEKKESEDLVLHLGSSTGGIREEAKCLKLVFGAEDLVSIKVESAQTGTVHYHLNASHAKKREFKITVTEEEQRQRGEESPTEREDEAAPQTVVFREAEYERGGGTVDEGPPESPVNGPRFLRGACHSSSFSGSSQRLADDSLELGVSDDGQARDGRDDAVPPLMNSRQLEASLCAPKRQGESVVEAIMRQDTLTLANLASSPTAVGDGNYSGGEFSVSRDSKSGGSHDRTFAEEGEKVAGEDGADDAAEDAGEDDSEVWYGGGIEEVSSDDNDQAPATHPRKVFDERTSPSPSVAGRKSEVISSFRPVEISDRPRNLSVAAGLFNPAGVVTTRILAAQEAAECARSKLDEKWITGRYGLAGPEASGMPTHPGVAVAAVDEGSSVRDREVVDRPRGSSVTQPPPRRTFGHKSLLKRRELYPAGELAGEHKTMEDLKELLERDVRRCNDLAQFQRSITPLLRESMEKAWNQGMLSYVASTNQECEEPAQSSQNFHT